MLTANSAVSFCDDAVIFAGYALVYSLDKRNSLTNAFAVSSPAAGWQKTDQFFCLIQKIRLHIQTLRFSVHLPLTGNCRIGEKIAKRHIFSEQKACQKAKTTFSRLIIDTGKIHFF